MGLFKVIEKPEDPKILRQKQRKIEKLKRKEEKKDREIKEEYGYLTSERLFEPAMLKEEAIIITFSPFTKELIRISEDGKFGLKYHREEKKCTLFFYKNPIKFDYNLEMEAILTEDSEIDIYKMISVAEAEQIALDIVRKERIEKRLQEMKEAGIDSLLNKIQKETNRSLEEEKEEALENVQDNFFGEGNVESESDSTERDVLFDEAFSNSEQTQENSSGIEEKRKEENRIRNIEEKKSETRREEPFKISWKELFNK